MRTILVINSKGGAGKTTLTTNVASYYANQKSRTAIMDFDPQGSSMQWLRHRPGHVESIHGAHAAPPNGAAPLNSHKAWIPDNTETLIIDAPAGIKGLMLKDLVRRASYILIPVTPSPIDIHATADFVKDLFLVGGARSTKAKIAVVANRVRNSSPSYDALERFLSALQLPFLTRISDSDNYIRAVEKGLGVFEMEETTTLAERQEFLPIFRWLEGDATVSVAAAVPVKHETEMPRKVVSIEKSGRFPSLRSTGRNIFSSLLNNTGKIQR
jgi:chromosome partitioning protein